MNASRVPHSKELGDVLETPLPLLGAFASIESSVLGPLHSRRPAGPGREDGAGPRRSLRCGLEARRRSERGTIGNRPGLTTPLGHRHFPIVLIDGINVGNHTVRIALGSESGALLCDPESISRLGFTLQGLWVRGALYKKPEVERRLRGDGTTPGVGAGVIEA